jgi:hypothetical protein
MRRALAVAGGRRTGSAFGGPNNRHDVADRYRQDHIGDSQSRKKFATDMVNFLEDAFEYGSPVNGSIFWTGIDENKLVKQVAIWNSEFPGEMFGQLEATTDARYINGGFDWDIKGSSLQTTQMFFGQVSGKYGALAKGHVTVVQLYGLRNDSIFTKKEFPTLLKHMTDALAKGQTPPVQDITIVVLDPLSSNDPYKTYTNYEICEVPVVRKGVPDSESRWMRNKNDAKIEYYVGTMVSAKLKAYWINRGKKLPSKAANKIMQDYPLIKR